MPRTIKQAVCVVALLFASSPLYIGCFGEGQNQVCTKSYTDSRGNTTIRSYDTPGNSYSVNTETYQTPTGNTIRSPDRMETVTPLNLGRTAWARTQSIAWLIAPQSRGLAR